ncbi:MAG: hypothetical protein JNM81_15730 [Rhodospirillaceae bacterium]|nr:hypothetical protein [Rhodospirillaceae bacterium]
MTLTTATLRNNDVPNWSVPLPSLKVSTLGFATSYPRLRLAFLYNHEASHQVAHSASVISAILNNYPQVEVSILATSDPLIEAIRRICGEDIVQRCKLIKLELPPLRRRLLRALDSVAPLSRIEQLKLHSDLLASFDAVVVTERTSLLLRGIESCKHLKLIYISHGAGDRSIGFKKDIGNFDLILLSGEKLTARFKAAGVENTDRIRIVGYPKLDSIPNGAPDRHQLFANDKPIVLYNPHFEPRLSSWYTMGTAVLDFFADNKDYNLIFAPHVMMFQRRVQISLENFTVRLRRDLPKRYFNLPNIHIDLGSTASTDMTYTRMADIYLGDASSQVYEFLSIQLRPCIHLNSHHAAWNNDPNYTFWNFGAVLDDVKDLDAALKTATVDHLFYRNIQDCTVQETFSRTTERPSLRAANAIGTFLGLAA